MIRSVLFGYNGNCAITLLKKYVYLLRTKTGTKCDLTKTRLGFYILNLHCTLGEVNKLLLCKPYGLTRVSFAKKNRYILKRLEPIHFSPQNLLVSSKFSHGVLLLFSFQVPLILCSNCEDK